MDQAGPPKSLKDHVQARQELPVAGLFARRGPSRPNPIGVSAVPILSRERNVLRVQALDAMDGTPLIDIKPYTPAFDRVENARIPEWCKQVYEIEDYL
jgi:tRNA (Thr-GGU) A37 N-methylase